MLCGCNCIAFVNLKTPKLAYLQLDLEGSTDETFFRYIELLLFLGGGGGSVQISLVGLYLCVCEGVTFRLL